MKIHITDFIRIQRTKTGDVKSQHKGIAHGAICSEADKLSFRCIIDSKEQKERPASVTRCYANQAFIRVAW